MKLVSFYKIQVSYYFAFSRTIGRAEHAMNLTSQENQINGVEVSINWFKVDHSKSKKQ